MSRSRRPQKLGKCFCGRGLIPFRGEGSKHRGRRVSGCPVLSYVHEANEMYEKYRERRCNRTEED